VPPDISAVEDLEPASAGGRRRALLCSRRDLTAGIGNSLHDS
jgi:hypothetical protein